MKAIPNVTYGTTKIEYSVKRSHQRNSAEVALDPELGVVVTCPNDLDENQVENLVIKKAPWILQKLKFTREGVAKPSIREYVSGETYHYLGRRYRLKVIEDESISPYEVKLRAGRFRIRVPPFSEENSREIVVPSALRWWFSNKAEKKLLERAKLYSSKIGVAPKKIVIKNQMKRWGSCTKDGVVHLNWRIIMAPMSVVDYVVAHELIHVDIDSHSKEFWKTLRTILPDYERRKEWLRVNGPSLFV